MKIKRGFTLVELLVVVTIIVLLTATAVVTYSTFLKQSRDAKRKSDLGEIAAALEMYRSNNDTYPATLSTLTSGTVYISIIPTDPQSSSYVYYYIMNSASDYTLGAHLENVVTTCQSLANQCTSNCTYCLGPYGQK